MVCFIACSLTTGSIPNLLRTNGLYHSNRCDITTCMNRSVHIQTGILIYIYGLFHKRKHRSPLPMENKVFSCGTGNGYSYYIHRSLFCIFQILAFKYFCTQLSEFKHQIGIGDDECVDEASHRHPPLHTPAAFALLLTSLEGGTPNINILTMKYFTQIHHCSG